MMGSVATLPNGRSQIGYYFGGKRHTVRLGLVDPHTALDFNLKLTRLVDTRKAGLSLSPDQLLWLGSLGDRQYRTLANSGLVEDRTLTTVPSLCDRYMAQLRDEGRKQSTLANAQVVCDNLVAYFSDRDIRDLTTDHAAAFRRHLIESGTTDYGPLAEATAGRRCRRSRSIFTLAVDEGLITKNPFRRLRIGNGRNRERDAYIPRQHVETLIAAAPDPQFKLLLAGARYAGFRGPSEVHPLRWDWFDWDRGTFTVHSPKTEHHDDLDQRTVPLFDEIRPYAEAARQDAVVGQTLVFPNWQCLGPAMAGRVRRLCNATGVPVWKKLFVNLRASCERDLFERHPIDKVAAWLGHSPETALRHYNRVIKEHDASAAGQSLRFSESEKEAK